MQLTFPSTPFDVTAMSPAAAGAAGTANAATGPVAGTGFAALLAGVVPLSPSGAVAAPPTVGVPPTGVPTVAVLPGPWTSGATVGSAPTALGQAGLNFAATSTRGTPALAVPLALAESALTGTPAVATGLVAPAPNPPEAAPTPAAKRKALVADGDVQALAVAMLQGAMGASPQAPVTTPLAAESERSGSDTATDTVSATNGQRVSISSAGGPYSAALASFAGARGMPAGVGAKFRMPVLPGTPSLPVGADALATTTTEPAVVAAAATLLPGAESAAKGSSANVPGAAAVPSSLAAPSAMDATGVTTMTDQAVAPDVKPTGAAVEATPHVSKAGFSDTLPGGHVPATPAEPQAALTGLTSSGDRSKPVLSGKFEQPGVANQVLKPDAQGVAFAAEKFAAAGVETPRSFKSVEKGTIKSALVSSSKEVGKGEEGLGIVAAETRATMSSGSLLDRPTVTDPTVVHSTAGGADAAARTAALPPEVTFSSSAHRAVEAALSATDRLASREQQSVNLQFTVGGNELSVRVELRAGEVHTTFRTDSAELRNALSNEWQSVTGQSSADRSVRLATPVFTSTNSGSNAFADSGANHQRHTESERAPSFATVMPREGRSSTVAETAAPAMRTDSANAVHLHTLA